MQCLVQVLADPSPVRPCAGPGGYKQSTSAVLQWYFVQCVQLPCSTCTVQASHCIERTSPCNRSQLPSYLLSANSSQRRHSDLDCLNCPTAPPRLVSCSRVLYIHSSVFKLPLPSTVSFFTFRFSFSFFVFPPPHGAGIICTLMPPPLPPKKKNPPLASNLYIWCLQSHSLFIHYHYRL